MLNLRIQEGDNPEVILVVDTAGRLVGTMAGLQGAEKALRVTSRERGIDH